ncbi:MAG: transposase [bacterium]|nr:transposase [bacterium]
MIRSAPLTTAETYHVYNRGAHKQSIFINDFDRDRFLLLLYIANYSERLHLGNLLQKYKGRSSMDVLTEEVVDKSLVDVFAYSLMPNHFHLILRQKADGGITTFMKKVGTAYSMYFNAKYDHSGVLFQGRFKSKHVDTDDYFRYLFAYIHLNPVELVEPGWKEHGPKNKEEIRNFMASYRYSSHYDYALGDRVERAILSYAEAPEFLKAGNDVEDLLRWYENIKDGPE